MAAAGRKSEREAEGFFPTAGRDIAGPGARLVVLELCAAGLTGLGGLNCGRRPAAFGGIVRECEREREGVLCWRGRSCIASSRVQAV